MIDDKIEDKIKMLDANKEGAKNLSQLVKKAMSLTDRIMLRVDESYDEKEYSIIVSTRSLMVFGAADPSVAYIGFEIKPITDGYGTVRGISIYTSMPKGEISSKSYDIAKDFAKKFEVKYLGLCDIEIKSFD
jgi:hypothetical protein